MTRTAQKSMLTRAIKSGDPLKVRAACVAALQQWNTDGMWPDDWHRWNIAYSDTFRWQTLDDLAAELQR